MIKHQLKTFLGQFLISCRPHYAEELAKKGMNPTLNQKTRLTDRLICHSLLENAVQKGNTEKLAAYYRNFWIKRGHDHFSTYNDTLKGFFLPHCDFLFEELNVLLRDHPTNFTTMVEIGTGHGDVLNYLSSKFSDIPRFIGIDLSPIQIGIIKKKYETNPKLEYIAGDALNWVKKNGKTKTIFFTSGGVLEYLTEQRLQKFLDFLNKLRPIIFIAIEPLGRNADFVKNPLSQPYGPERSFSHNYLKMFKNAGFEIWHDSIVPYQAKTFDFWAIGAKN